MDKVVYRGRVFSNDDNSHLYVMNANGVKVKIMMKLLYMFAERDINVGSIKKSNDPLGLQITGRDSGRVRVIPDDKVLQIISFVDNDKKTKDTLEGEYTIYLYKKGNVNENYLHTLIKKILNEQETERYMFFSNLEQIKRQCEMLLKKDKEEIESILDNGHDWAQDHIAEAKNNMDQVFDFLMNETNKKMMSEGKKKAGTKLCSRGKSAAKAKFKVYPSAYANGYAVQVCKGRMPGTDGKKKCSPPYC